MRNLSGIYGGLSWYVSTMNLNNSEFIVFPSVCLLAYFLTEIMSIWGYIQFWMRHHSDFLETFREWLCTISKWVWISCMSVNLFVSLLPYWYYVNMGISPVLDEISFWHFLVTFPGYLYTNSFHLWNSCMSLSLLVGLLPYSN